MYILINDVLFVIDVNVVQSINTLWHSVAPIKKMNRFWGDSSVDKALDLQT